MPNQKSTRVTGHPTAERAAEIDRDIIEATLREFAEQGHAFKMDTVAERAGVSKQAIYRRWTSKEDLLVYAVDAGAAVYHAALTKDLPADPLEALRIIAWQHFNHDEYSSRISVFIRAESVRMARLHALMVKWRGEFSAVIIGCLRALADNVSPAEVDLITHADMLMDITWGAHVRLATEGIRDEETRMLHFDRIWGSYLRLIGQ